MQEPEARHVPGHQRLELYTWCSRPTMPAIGALVHLTRRCDDMRLATGLWPASHFSSHRPCPESMPVLTITRRATFAAAHRLYLPHWDDLRNEAVFGRCAHPGGHGHNYVLEVTVGGSLD